MPELRAAQMISEITSAFEAAGHFDYGEHINMREHMLQSAAFAARQGEPDTVVAAVLLHDYGHLVCNMPNDIFFEGIDNRHEEIGANALAKWFVDEIVDGVRLHVEAKRYLCAKTPGYFDRLTPASVVSLEVQGGPMSEEEMTAFGKHPGHRMALKVRLYDDLGKEIDMDCPRLDHYLPLLTSCMRGPGS